MAGIRYSQVNLASSVSPSKKDRERLDFSRLPHKLTSLSPTVGVPFKVLLEIASEVCKKRITELTQIKTKGQLQKIERRVRKWHKS